MIRGSLLTDCGMLTAAAATTAQLASHSIVIHAADGAAPRLACAALTPLTSGRAMPTSPCAGSNSPEPTAAPPPPPPASPPPLPQVIPSGLYWGCDFPSIFPFLPGFFTEGLSMVENSLMLDMGSSGDFSSHFSHIPLMFSSNLLTFLSFPSDISLIFLSYFSHFSHVSQARACGCTRGRTQFR